jgi:hypothetical protein
MDLSLLEAPFARGFLRWGGGVLKICKASATGSFTTKI